MKVERVAEQVAPAGQPWPQGWRSVLTHTHTYSGRADHGGPVQPPDSYARLAAWTRRLGIDALGMGSPYTPRSAATYERFDGPERERYYGGEINLRAVLDAGENDRMLAQANAAGAGRTLFYLDNETPKGRYGHLWWVGYRQVVPAWHDYDQPYDRWMLEQARAGEDGDEPVPYERRPYLQIVAEQRAHGALGVWAHPTSWWPGDAGQFVTNIAAEMPAHAIAEGRLDGLVVMGYQPWRPEYLAIWFALLDRGYRVPGLAEMDCGLSDPGLWERPSALLTYVWAPGDPFGVDSLAAAVRGGRLFASSGPFVDLEVDGHPMGSIAPTARGQVHTVRLTALPEPGGGPLDRVELVGLGGRVVWSREGFPGGTVELRVPGLGERGYLLARVVAAGVGRRWREPSRVAVGSPVALHPAGMGFGPPAVTQVTVTIQAQSPFCGGEARFEAMDGALLGRATARAGTVQETLPASGRVTLLAPDGRRRTDYLLNANPALQAAQRYLYRGRFLRDFPDCRPGEVPPEAWQLDRHAEALQTVRLSY